MVVCVHIPRFELLVAIGKAGELIGKPVALAPLPGQASRIGEASGTAEALGVRCGMELGEALVRAPNLQLVAPDPMAVVEQWERVARSLEAIGAFPELERPGVAYFQADELYRLHGGLEGVVRVARQALHPSVRLGAGPTRFCALAASRRARSNRAVVVNGDARRYLSPHPVALLNCRPQTAPLVKALERLGISTLGNLAALSRTAMANRFGSAGVLAHELARGIDTPLSPRRPEDRVWESLNLVESANGQVLERTLIVLIDRLLARPEREGRSLRAVVLGARLVGGGTWREHIVFRQALSDRERIALALSLRLIKLPAPASSLWLSIESFGTQASGQIAMFEESKAVRMARLREAIAQTRALAGPTAAMRVVWIDPDSSVPERRAVLTPFPA